MRFGQTIRPLSELENLEIQRERLQDLTQSNLLSPTVSRQIKATLVQVERQIAMLKSSQRLAA
jgi:hypothetical protein